MCVCWGIGASEGGNRMTRLILFWVDLGIFNTHRSTAAMGVTVVRVWGHRENRVEWGAIRLIKPWPLSPPPDLTNSHGDRDPTASVGCHCCAKSLDLNMRTRTLWHTKILRLDRTWPQMKGHGGNTGTLYCLCVCVCTEILQTTRPVAGSEELKS